MALVNCSECGAEVSTNAAACPKCGNPIAAARVMPATAAPKKQETSLGMKIVRTTLVVILGIVALASWVNHETGSASNSSASDVASSPAQSADTSAPAPTPAPAAEPAQPPVEITADALFADYKANEVAADQKYKGRMLKVSGVIGSIGKDVMDNPYITLRTTDNEFETVNAYFTKNDIDRLSKLNKGDSVTVTCRGDGFHVMSPVLDCKRG